MYLCVCVCVCVSACVCVCVRVCVCVVLCVFVRSLIYTSDAAGLERRVVLVARPYCHIHNTYTRV